MLSMYVWLKTDVYCVCMSVCVGCSRARSGAFTDNQVEYLIQGLLHGRAANKFLLTEGGRLDAFVNLLKIGKLHAMEDL